MISYMCFSKLYIINIWDKQIHCKTREDQRFRRVPTIIKKTCEHKFVLTLEKKNNSQSKHCNSFSSNKYLILIGQFLNTTPNIVLKDFITERPGLMVVTLSSTIFVLVL